MFEVEKIKKEAQKDWEKTWRNTAKLVMGKEKFKPKKDKGKNHILYEYILRIREVLLDLGFDEVILQQIQPYEEVIKQYGPEAGAILDRIYYLATLPRPDIGLSEKKKNLIRKRLSGFDRFKELQEILMKYKRGEIEGGEDFTEILVTELGVTTSDALYIIEKVFPELKKITPEPTNLSLISHATTSWFPLLAKLQDRKEHPVMLFSLPWRYRREQREDASHLRAHMNFTIVILDNDFKIENGKEVTKVILERLGFREIKFKTKPNEPAYYAPNTNYEIFVKFKDKEIEVAEMGMYSPVSLANYKIKYPVFNIGIGLGRIVMAGENMEDIRELYYPDEYGDLELSDEEIAKGIEIDKKPETEEGKKLVKIIEKGIIENKDLFGIIEKEIFKNKISISVVEPEEGKKLLGPGGLNELYVYKGNILAIKPGDSRFKEIEEKGIRVYSFLKAISNYFAWKAERGEKGISTIKYSDTLPSINLKLKKEIEIYLASKNKKIQINSPVFIDIKIS
jgi:O-phosphoseryl-tRNA synthetase